MTDIESDLCDLPTGVFSLAFLPRHEISHWENGLPIPLNRWYGIGVYRDSLQYQQPTAHTENGNLTQVSVSCLVVNDSQELADQLEQMGYMLFVLRVTHYDGRIRLVGAPDEFARFESSEYTPDQISGAQGYKLNFAGSFIRRPSIIAA